MKFHLTFAAIVLLLIIGPVSAQPIKTPYVFIQSGNDTVASAILPLPPSGISQRVMAVGSHFAIGDKKTDRIRFFGTELEWTSQFLNSSDARILAKHLHKLGFNAVRFVYNDYYYWNVASFFENVNQTTSYNLNPVQLAMFDTLIYEFKNQGIYSFVVLNSVHDYFPDDGVAQWDTIHGNGQFVHFIDKQAAQLHRNWANTLLSHVNPLTGLRLADDPAIADGRVLFFWGHLAGPEFTCRLEIRLFKLDRYE